jgi:GT2 family glycosyltransferase
MSLNQRASFQPGFKETNDVPSYRNDLSEGNELPAQQLVIAVGVATVGRREVLAKMTDFLAHQTRLPDRLVVCPVAPGDVDTEALERFPAPTLVVSGPIGLPAQRNRILSAVTEADIIVFFDDDFFADPSYLSNLETNFRANPDVVAITGYLLADGAKGPGLSVEQGLEIVQARVQSVPNNAQLVDFYGAYGCNMSFRLEPVRRQGILFDENLPLYGWQEDIDFALRMAPHGRVTKSEALRGVHLGIKVGRTSGVRFGYSQIANPIYLIRKGTMSWKHARMLMWRNLAANFVRSFFPEPWVDRKGRLKGNVLALIDMALGRISPRRILQLD